MKSILLAILLILSTQTLWSQRVSNVNFLTSGKQIVVSYDLSGEASSDYAISLYYSINDGPWQGPIKSVTGNIGLGQKAGSGKKITWSVLDELDKLSGEISFKVQVEIAKSLDGPNGSFTDSRDNKTYKWVRIGEQLWMAENLAWLPSVNPSKTGSEKEKFYYVYGFEGVDVSAAKAAANYGTYGVLYNWPAALTACPAGWHLPDDAEWKFLEKYLGISNSGADNAGWRTSGMVGGRLKESGSSRWANPNTGANNSSGFTALPGGYRSRDEGFLNLYEYAYFWSSSEYAAWYAWSRGLGCNGDGVSRYYYYRDFGLSIRCLQNK